MKLEYEADGIEYVDEGIVVLFNDNVYLHIQTGLQIERHKLAAHRLIWVNDIDGWELATLPMILHPQKAELILAEDLGEIIQISEEKYYGDEE
jgi:hypothetical protein